MAKQRLRQLQGERQLVQELNIHSLLSHPQILQLYGFFHDDLHVYIILEYCDGGSLY